MPSSNFYTRLPTRTHFSDVTDPEAYAPVPDDWHVAITDVRGSTQAIREGRYKEVNLVGASSIIALLNLAPETDLPFSFGGDGSAFLIPPDLTEKARFVLADTHQRAAREFALDLRAGLVPVTAIRAAGLDVRVARLQITEDCYQAMFDGGGLAYAEQLVKDESTADRFSVSADAAREEADYTGLECRWQDISSPHGETVTLLISATTDDDDDDRAVYNRVLRCIEECYGDVIHHRPLSPQTLRPTFSPEKLSLEAKLRARGGWLGRQGYLWRSCLLNVLFKYLVKYRQTLCGVRWDHYIAKLIGSSDYRKYDDMLRMVIAGTSAQREQLTAHLEDACQAGRLVYGMHVTDRALLTCVVFERMGRQIHFVDGADGGYALAARDLKRRAQQAPPTQKGSAA